MADLRTLISQATTTAMKARDKPRLAALRLINAALKQVEVDERKELNDDDVIAVEKRTHRKGEGGVVVERPRHEVSAVGDDLHRALDVEIELAGVG